MAQQLPHIGSLHLQPRDLSILRMLLDSRVLTSTHIAALHFSGKREATKKRLQKLQAAKLVTARPRKPNEKAVYSLTPASLRLLRTEGILDEYPSLELAALQRGLQMSDATARHVLHVMEVKVAFHTALANSSTLRLVEFSTWPLLYEFKAERSGKAGETWVRPDGYIRIEEKDPDRSIVEHCFFLEVGTSSPTQDSLITRASAYVAFYRSGGFALRHGARRTDFRQHPFRVLMIFKSAAQRNNASETMLGHSPPFRAQFCLATEEQVTTHPLDKIWLSPGTQDFFAIP